MLQAGPLQQLDVCHSAETEMRDKKRLSSHTRKELFLQIRTGGQWRKCGPETDPEPSSRHCRRASLDSTRNANLSETLRCVVREEEEEKEEEEEA